MEEIFDSEKVAVFKQKAKYVGIGIGVGLLIALLVVAVWNLRKKEPDKKYLEVTQIDPTSGKSIEKEVTIEFVSKKLENLNELSTAQMTYTGIYSVIEGSIPFITQKGFSMVYTATIKSGIDMSLIEIYVTDSQVVVRLPDPEIQMIKVEPSSIQFYDEKRALFNPDKKTDVTEAIRIAESDLEEKTDLSDLLDLTSDRAEMLVAGLLSDVIGERELVIK